MSNEIHELHEHAQHAHADSSLVPVTMTMAILAVLVALVSLLGHRTNTEELLLQNKATDQWSYFQAKNIRRHSYEVFLDLLSISNPKDTEAAEKIKEKYTHEVERYADEQKEIEAEAKKLEKEMDVARKETDRFELGEVFLESALVICSITLLTKRRLYWGFGLVLGSAGLVVAASTLWIG